MAEIPPKTDGRKPAAATCALALVPDRPGTVSAIGAGGYLIILGRKKLHINSLKIHRINVIFGRVTLLI